MPPKHAAINKKSASADNPHRDAGSKKGLRSKSTIMRLNMYKRGKPVRNKEGTVIGGTLMMDNKAGGKDVGSVVRIAPDRRWFGNTRTVSQVELDKFREQLTVKQADPYSVLLRRKKIPVALLQESSQQIANNNIIENESYDSTFGSKMKRKRPKLSEGLAGFSELVNAVAQKTVQYDSKLETVNANETEDGDLLARKDDLFAKGQSKRIWGELYKVLDCSDVVLQIVDARNVPGTRCNHIENHIKKNAPHKHMVIIINKCDLVPSWVTKRWVKILSAEYPTLAFHASITNSFGKGALISLLRQFGKLHADKRQISVGVIGYPNCGKSSIINTLMGKKCCRTAPIPGETKIWQYITLMRRIYLVDCPGVVYDTGDNEVDTVLKGVIRAERLESPADFIAPILERVRTEHIQKFYQVSNWNDHIDFLNKVSARTGRFHKGGEYDIHSVAINVINDWQRGKLPYFVPPPTDMASQVADDADDGGDLDEHLHLLTNRLPDGGDGALENEESSDVEASHDSEVEEGADSDSERESGIAAEKGPVKGKKGFGSAKSESGSWCDI